MDEQAKLMLYRQLQEMSELNQKENAASLISEQEFLALSAKEALKYTFEYRDRETDFGENIYYLEMPDMDFSGQDLSDVRISKFMLSRMEDGKRVPSKINVNGTRIAINLNGIGISEQSQDELGISDQVIDFSNVDFRGCEIRGILPDEYAEETKAKTRGQITVTGRENLDERYLQRRKEHHLMPGERKVTERAYARLLSGETLKGTRDQDRIDFTDYDLEGLSEEQIRYLMDKKEITLDTYQIESNSDYVSQYRKRTIKRRK